MKKYLIKGALALFATGLFFSCAEKESEYVPLAQQKSKAFDDVFKEIYGDVDPYQDWGFSSGKVVVDPNDSTQVVEVIDLDDNVAVTRAVAFSRAGTRTVVDANGNMWQDPPTVGTTEPNDVYNYVRTLESFNFSAPTGLTNFYVTHIYTGNKGYYDINGDGPTVGSNHMDQLIIADNSPATINASTGALDRTSSWRHVYDFNNAKNVDYDGNMLLLESGTLNFAYWNSLDSKWHDKWIAVDGSSINAEKYGDYVYICFDFEATPKDGDDNYTEIVWYTYGPNNKDHDPNGEKFDHKTRVSGTVTLDELKAAGTKLSDTMIGRNDGEFAVDEEGTFGWEITQYSQGDKFIPGDDVYTDWIIRLVKADGCKIEYTHPEYTDDEWTQIERGRVFCEDLGQATREDLDYNDVVFDAIVFKKESTTRRWEVKWVDDVKTDSVELETYEGVTYPIETTTYYANVTLLAAGGTIPVTIQSNKEGSTTYQVHDAFSAGITTMINTRDNNSTAFGSFDSRPSIQLGDISKTFVAKLDDGSTHNYDIAISLFEIDYPSDGKAIEKIKLYTNFNVDQQFQELTSIRGEAPRKFMAPIGTPWTSERKNISLAFPLFGDWVANRVSREACFSSSNTNTDYTYSEAYSSTGNKLPLVMKARRSYVSGIEHELWSGSNEFGSTWNLKNVETNHPLSSTKDEINFYPGDRLRFYGTKILEDAWITVVIGSLRPYFVDSEFPNYILNSDGSKTLLSEDQTSCVEVLLDEWGANELNTQIKNNNGILKFEVQGRNFTLTRICRVLFN